MRAPRRGYVIRKAVIGDVHRIQRLVNLYATKGTMLGLSLSEIYDQVRDFTVAEGPRRALLELVPSVLPARPRIAVNCTHVTRTRVIRLELADEQGKVVPGYSFRNCVPVTREGLKRQVRWRRNRTARELSGRKVQIRVELISPDCGPVYSDSPRLYAVYTG